MKSKLAVPLFWFLSCGWSQAAAPSITVFVDFEQEPSPPSVAQMKDEVASILKPSGLTLNWLSLNSRADSESFPDLIVLKFKGSCQVHNPALDSELGPAIEGSALATTVVSDGKVLPFTDVKCNEIRKYLLSDMAGYRQAKQEQIYGKALGRVVAHEMYHIFAATEEHGRDGVARAFHTRRDLTNKEFRFTPKETATLHEIKWRALLAGEGEAVSWP